MNKVEKCFFKLDNITTMDVNLKRAQLLNHCSQLVGDGLYHQGLFSHF